MGKEQSEKIKELPEKVREVEEQILVLEEQSEEIKELSEKVREAYTIAEGGKPKEKKICTCLIKKVKADQKKLPRSKLSKKMTSFVLISFFIPVYDIVQFSFSFILC